MMTRGPRIKGTTRKGFITMGRPNTTGSLTLKILGAALRRPMSFRVRDFAKRSRKMTRGRVAPEPPICRKLSIKGCATTFGIAVPAWNAARFSTVAV